MILGYTRDGRPTPLPPQMELWEDLGMPDPRTPSEQIAAVRAAAAARAAAVAAQPRPQQLALLAAASSPAQTNERRLSVCYAQPAGNRSNAELW